MKKKVSKKQPPPSPEKPPRKRKRYVHRKPPASQDGFPLTNQPLTPRQEAFCREYLIDLNAYAAAIRAGYADTSTNGYHLLQNPKVVEAISALKEERNRRTDISADRVLEELGRVAFLDPRRFYHPDGTVKQPHEMDPDIAACISSIEVEERFTGGVPGVPKKLIGYTKKVRFWDKLKALELAGRHVALFPTQSNVNVTGNINTQAMTDEELFARLQSLAEKYGGNALPNDVPGSGGAITVDPGSPAANGGEPIKK